jgi:hypothetical protein
MASRMTIALLQEGFRLISGDTEEIVSGRGRSRQQYVRNGKPCTWNSRNLVYVVYDEDGEPWVMYDRQLKPGTLDRIRSTVSGYGLDFRQEGYVPHTQDGGNRIQRMFGYR